MVAIHRDRHEVLRVLYLGIDKLNQLLLVDDLHLRLQNGVTQVPEEFVGVLVVKRDRVVLNKAVPHRVEVLHCQHVG